MTATASRPCPSTLLLAVVCLAAARAAAASGPGILELDGGWRYRLAGGTGAGAVLDDETGWNRVELPAAASELGVTTGAATLWLRRDLGLEAGWQERLAPSGLALLISSAAGGDGEIVAGSLRIGAWSDPLPGIWRPPPRVYSLPADAVDSDGSLRLLLRWHRPAQRPVRASRRHEMLGEGWLLGDLQRLRAEAELRRLRALNGDQWLAILALLYAAIGVYHLQLFRRDPRCREYLWFGLTAIVVACHTLLYTPWLSIFSEHPVAVRRFYDLTGSLIVASSIQFLWPLLQRPIGRTLKTYQLSFVALAVLLAVLPEASWVPRAQALVKFWSVPFLVAVARLLWTEVRRATPEARTIAVGGFAIVAAGLAEMSSQLLGRGTTFPLQAVAFTIFALSMAFSLSNRFSTVHRELDALRLQLEEMVEDRAAELSSANERLQSEIAERELAQEAMRMLERAVEQSIDGILVADLEERTLFLNEAWARMHSHETFEVFGGRLKLFHTPEQMEEEVHPALERVREDGSWEGEVAHRRKDGSVFPTWMSVTLLRDPAGEPVGVVAAARDITERQRAEREMQRTEARIRETEKLQSLADLAGGIAHDYNNLLTGVLVHSSLALRELPPRSVASDKLKQIGAAAERAADLTEQLLTYAGAESPVTERIGLSNLLAFARGELCAAAGPETRLEIDLAEGLPDVEANAAQVRRAVVSLVANAVDAIDDAADGVVEIETGRLTADAAYLADSYPDQNHAPGEYVFVRVSDNGCGIDEGQRSRIFDPFFSTKPSARGLGLATVLSTVRAHRGTIKVTSLRGQGASFELLFPVAGERLADRGEVVESARSWQGSGTVLVVDDEHIMREVSRSILEQSGFEVLATGEGQRALDLYREHMDAIRLVLLDRTMPTMSGEEVLDRILALNPQAQVLLMSGYKEDAAVRLLTSRGLAEFLAKPFRPEELVDKVRRILEPEA